MVALIRQRIVITLSELQAELGPVSLSTARLKLAAAGCRASYSHNGRYYTLDELADFDVYGIWSYGDIRFSRSGTLTATLEAITERAYRGLYARDLEQIVQVDVRSTLSRLAQAGRVSRVKAGGRYLYCSNDAARRQQQQRNHASSDPVQDETYEHAEQSLLGLLNEQQRRLYAGLESLRHGSGGDNKVASRLGMARATVTKGRRQLLSGEFESQRIRKPGGGRKPLEKKR